MSIALENADLLGIAADEELLLLHFLLQTSYGFAARKWRGLARNWRELLGEDSQALLLRLLQISHLLLVLAALLFDHLHGQLGVVQLLLQGTHIDATHIQVGQVEVDPKYVAGSALITALGTGL